MNFVERVPYALLIVLAIVMALVPPGQSHLLEKTRMLFSGTLKRPLDIFDLLMHSAPLILLVVKAVLDLTRRSGGGSP
jgi:hypothetical protein